MVSSPNDPAAAPFVLGVNYWPRKKAMSLWSGFDRGEVAEEFAQIREIGMNVVRVFLLWDDFQPTPDAVSPERLEEFEAMADVAARLGLGLDVTFFTGHMSGPNWAPRWLLDSSASHPSPHVWQVISGGRVVPGGSYKNPFSDPIARRASRLLLETVVGRFRQHPAIWMWNLGNEPDLFAWPASADEGRAWVREMRELIRGLDAAHPVTCGLHAASLFEDNGLRVDQVFRETDVAVMHGYPMYVPWARHELDPDFVPFLCALTSALSGKPTLAEEWGGCTAPGRGPSTFWEWTSYRGEKRRQFMANEEAFAEYVELVLPRLVEVGSTGALLWCFADYAEELWDRPPCDPSGARHERHFGLVRPDGSWKPHAEVIRKFAASSPRVQPARRVIEASAVAGYYDAPSEKARVLYEQYQSAPFIGS